MMAPKKRRKIKTRLTVREDYQHCLPIEDLIAQGDLATQLGVRTSAISNWRNRYQDFPRPIIASELDHVAIYLWPEVKKWIRSTTRTWVVR